MPKLFYGLIGPLTVAIILIGAIGEKRGFTREIDQPPAVLANALNKLDLLHQPKTKVKLSEADRHRLPLLLVQHDADGVSWFVMSEGKSVLQLKAELTPTANGAATMVSTRVEPGQVDHAPEIPAIFTDKAKIEPLFAIAVERALGDYIPRSERTLYSLAEKPRQ